MPVKAKNSWFDWLTWSSLRGVGNSYAAKVTILIPLFAYLIIFNDKVVSYLHLAVELGGSSAHAEVSPKLLLVYFGLVSIAIGAALYGIFCPPGVKSYGSSNFYVLNVQDAIKDFKFEEYENELRVSRWVQEYNRIRDRYEVLHTYGISDEQKAQINNGVLHLYFKYQNLKYPVARVFTAVFFAVGFGCLSLPSAGVFWRVSKILYRTITTQFSTLF